MSKWEDKYLKEPVDGWQFPPDFLREMAHAINDESNESIEMEELEAVLLHLLKLDSSHPEQGEQGELYKWVKASERLPQVSDDTLLVLRVKGQPRFQLGYLDRDANFVIENLVAEKFHPNKTEWLCKLSSPPPEGQDERIKELEEALREIEQMPIRFSEGSAIIDMKEIAKQLINKK